ncbi:MAG: LemA family protein [Thermoplasmatota archaeon]
MAWQAIVAVLVLLLLVFIGVAATYYNRFVTLANRCDESWSNVDTELQRRHELIPNLVATVKGYAAHEKSIMEQVTKARAAAVRARRDGLHDGAMEARLSGALDKLLAVAEAYPDLKASDNFLELQRELAITEDRIQAARRFYNANVRDHRNATRQFPGTLFAAWFKPAPQDFFEADAPAAVQVQI